MLCHVQQEQEKKDMNTTLQVIYVCTKSITSLFMITCYIFLFLLSDSIMNMCHCQNCDLK